jgi:hypothetical protein
MKLPAIPVFLLFCAAALLPPSLARATNVSAINYSVFKIKVLEADGSDYTHMELRIKQSVPSKKLEEVVLDMGGGERISIPLQEAERGPVPLNADKINFATVQASTANAAGDRTVRLKFNSRYAVSSVKTTYDLQLKLAGPDKVPMVLLNGREVSSLELRLNKKVSGKSLLRMLFSPPKVAKAEISTIGCANEEVIKHVQRYHSADYPRRLGCRLKNISKDDASLLSFIPDVFGSFYIGGEDSTEEIKASVATAKALHSLGLNFARLGNAGGNSLLTDTIRGGDRPLFDYLVAQGMRPREEELEAALVNYFQYDFSKGKLVVSPTGKYFFEKMKALAPEGSLKDLVQAVLLWEELPLYNSSVDALNYSVSNQEQGQIRLQYYLATFQLALDNGWDPFLPLSSSDARPESSYETIKNDSGHLFTAEQKKQILALLDRYAQKQAAAKSNSRAIATVNQSLKNLGAGCGCQRN